VSEVAASQAPVPEAPATETRPSADPSPRTLSVSLAYVGPSEAVLLSLSVPSGATLKDAIDRSEVLRRCPEIDLGRFKVGIYGKVAPLEQPLEDGDRVEIYRPLIADPKEARKRRADEGKGLKKGGA
jgi:putative ubiquitin-RnfH superfamily antitoxin RatB of RatAB toxin-antitoxin module